MSKNNENHLDVTVSKKSSFFKKFIIFLLVILAILGILVFFAVRDNRYGEYDDVTPSSKFVSTALVSIVLDNHVTISDDELNSYMAYFFSKKNQNQNSTNIEGMYFEFDGEAANVNVYMPVAYYGVHLGLTCDANLLLNKETQKLELSIKNSKLGMLPIPNRFLANKASSVFGNKVQTEKNTMYIDAKISISTNDNSASVDITDLYFEGDNIEVKTTETLKAIEDYIRSMI